MKNLLKQFYNEGFATTFYKKPLNYINKKIKNKKLSIFLSYILKIIYTIIFITLAIYILYIKLK